MTIFLQIGKTKVFLRAGQMAELDARRSEVLGRSASKVQRKFLTHSAQKKYNSLKQSSIHIQAVCRGINRCIIRICKNENLHV